MSERLQEDLLKVACQVAFDAEVTEHYEHPHPHEFSPAFERKMKKLIKRADKRADSPAPVRKISKRKVAVLLAAAILVLTTTTVLAVEPLRNGLYQLVQEVFSDYARITFQASSDTEAVQPSEFEVCELGYLPEGFALVQEDDMSEMNYYRGIYEESGGEQLFFEQEITSETSFNAGINKQPYKELEIQGLRSYYIEDAAFRTVVLFNDNYVWKIYGTITKNELIKVAENIKMNKE